MTEPEIVVSILAAFVGGLLLGWQARADYTAWRARRQERVS